MGSRQMYRLTRDDGTELTVSGGAWEAALELASLYGWEPEGTESARARAQGQPGGPEAPSWNRLDYFSRESQRVGTRDARALGESVLRALARIPDRGASEENPSPSRRSVLPSRLSAKAEGITAFQRRRLQQLAKFADCGGFRITGSG
jgi:hypothetical protein